MTRLDTLLSPQGQELLDRLADQEVTPDTVLRLGVELRRIYPGRPRRRRAGPA
ncbi:MAG: hypothetical protein ACRDYA_10720 [Egibacteraceae bacterium]